MLEPGDPDFAAFGGGPVQPNGAAGNGHPEGIVEDELDAFNDETFGGGTDEWMEDAHEELAQLTEEERNALKASNDFFEFGSDDEGCALEAEPSLDHPPAATDSRGSLDEAADQLMGALKPKPGSEVGLSASNNNVGNGNVSTTNSTLKQQFQKLNLGQVAAPLTIETNEPGVIQPQVVYQHQQPPVHIIQQQQSHFQIQQQQQQIRYNLVPPGHFQAGGGDPRLHPHHQSQGGVHQAGQGVHHQQIQQAPLHDPAIMSFSKIPVIGPFPAGTLGLHHPGAAPLPAPPHPHHQQAPLHHHHQPGMPVHQLTGGPGQAPLHLPHGYLGLAPHHQQPPPTVMGFKTMQDLENEMLYGKPGPGQQPVGGPGHMQHQPPNSHHQSGYMQHQGMKQQLNNRNLNYPGMRDRQQHPVRPMHDQSPRGHHSNNHDRNFHGGHSDRNSSNNHQYNNQQGPGVDRNFQRNLQGGGGNMNDRSGYNHYQRAGGHRDQMDMRNNRHQQNDEGYLNQRGMHDNENSYINQNTDYHKTENNDDNNWRWNEVRNRNRDSATRKDLMPGHVHTLGILRHSRARHVEVDLEDDCLGATDTAPLINPTGDPALDARLAQEQEELTSRARWFNDTEDEYAGLMSARDKQFITNIQLNQLKCDNPYVDDYYYTMFIAKKQKCDESERTGQMLLSENPEHETNYRPMQFENSLGKLQAVSVKAPRQIIDLPVVRTEELDPEPVQGAKGSPNLATSKNKRVDDYKSTLLQLERVYSILLDVESLKLKLSAIPTGVPLREQVTMEMTKHVQCLAANLSKPGLIPLYLQIRKGRELVARALKHLPGAAVARISQEMLVHLWLVCKDGKSVDLLWSHLYRHSQSSSLGNLEAGVNCWVKGKDSALKTMLTSPLGVSTVLATLYRATLAAKRGQEKISVGVWRELMIKLISWHSEGGSLASPLVTPQPLDIGFLLTLPDKQLHAWEIIMTSVGLEK
jgi:hypothetical protein